MSIRVGIVGYGNLGRGVEQALARQQDLHLVGIYTRRDPLAVAPASGDVHVGRVDELADEDTRAGIDVLILCGGSRLDLPEQGPELARSYTTVDSFDTHARIPEYFAAVDAAARAGNTTAIISVGWDPGLFSLNRVYAQSVLPQGTTATFWGKGLSQGHSDAVRRVPGVAAGVQYTVPNEEAIARVRAGTGADLATRDKHTRHCYVVLADGADAEEVRSAIVTMPDYFADYDTTVTFISAEELRRDHSAMPHGGVVIHSGETSPGTVNSIEYRLTLASNPEFTASVLVAYARAAHRLSSAGEHGAKTVYDIAPGLLSPRSPEQLRAGEL
ncbi:diaminopimelate dehydrogenase [Pseudactinotalea sp. HY158]|uniref:diaminopimelate dehydrogenase n=1 Tax=Pseudactinotalea sp. HY158 TaxID=2654547 RepID=UPI00129CC67A|nr:diaminopimelate dehydrogenase [Pseudactinotalea sp. HY158]QGH69511.1 diaminopimelate dehydrogenase [Pseudactinotalea sp. HY158]